MHIFFNSGNKLPYETINDERIFGSFLNIYCVETVYISTLLDVNMRSINTELKNKFAN